MQYIKHYYVNDDNNTFCCETVEPKYKRHPHKEYSGLDVKIWGTDADGVDVCLSEVPDSTSVATVSSDCGKNAVQVLTKTEYDTVATPYSAAQALFAEAQQAKQDDDEELATTKETEAQAKLNQALTALRTL